MPSVPRVKICGLSTPDTVSAATKLGADMIGFVFFPPSPRSIDFETAKELTNYYDRSSCQLVALVVDANDEIIDQIMVACKPDWLQLHGSEDVERIAEVQSRTGCKTLKAIKVRNADDLKQTEEFREVADMILFDPKPPKELVDALPGGNGLTFDWAMLAKGSDFRNHLENYEFMLAGGLTPDNVEQAIDLVSPNYVDVSSGVEVKPGVKDVDLIRKFITKAKSQ